MSRLDRPYIPLSVRVQVAERQLEVLGRQIIVTAPSTLKVRLHAALQSLFEGKPSELHHRPALMNRRRKRNGDYDPPANDPAHLVYLLKDEEHKIETYVRGQRGQLSDAGLRRKNKRMAKNRAKKLDALRRDPVKFVRVIAPQQQIAPFQKRFLRAAFKSRGKVRLVIEKRRSSRWPPKGSQKIGWKR